MSHKVCSPSQTLQTTWLHLESLMKKLLNKLHDLAHGQWQHRNSVMHDPDKNQQQAAQFMLKQCITEEHKEEQIYHDATTHSSTSTLMIFYPQTYPT